MSQRLTESDRVQGMAAMDVKSNRFLHWLFLTVVLVPFSAISLYGQPILVDPSARRQTIIGFGVNANPQSWNADPAAVKKVIDQLVDSLGCTSFRLMFDDCDWEKTNDNDDPEIYNWAFYDSLYTVNDLPGSGR